MNRKDRFQDMFTTRPADGPARSRRSARTAANWSALGIIAAGAVIAACVLVAPFLGVSPFMGGLVGAIYFIGGVITLAAADRAWPQIGDGRLSERGYWIALAAIIALWPFSLPLGMYWNRHTTWI